MSQPMYHSVCRKLSQLFQSTVERSSKNMSECTTSALHAWKRSMCGHEACHNFICGLRNNALLLWPAHICSTRFASVISFCLFRNDFLQQLFVGLGSTRAFMQSKQFVIGGRRPFWAASMMPDLLPTDGDVIKFIMLKHRMCLGLDQPQFQDISDHNLKFVHSECGPAQASSNFSASSIALFPSTIDGSTQQLE